MDLGLLRALGGGPYGRADGSLLDFAPRYANRLQPGVMGDNGGLRHTRDQLLRFCFKKGSPCPKETRRERLAIAGILLRQMMPTMASLFLSLISILPPDRRLPRREANKNTHVLLREPKPSSMCDSWMEARISSAQQC
jgi:hypothetical protein